MTRLSVVVCTRNRARFLSGLLETFQNQTVSPSEYELVIVDNASTDTTSEIAGHFQQTLKNLVYVREERIGLSYARNCGWNKAVGLYVGFVDDECRLPPDWLEIAFGIASSIKPDIFGGPYFPAFEAEKPRWFKDEYASFNPGGLARALNSGEFLSGGNLFVRRDILQTLNGFRPELGMKGNRIGGGEETQLMMELRKLKSDAVIYYDPALRLNHIVLRKKMNLYYMAARYFVSGRSYACMTAAKADPLKKNFWRIRMLIKEIIVAFTVRDRMQYPYFQNYLVERGFGYLFHLGHWFEEFSHGKEK